jgi:predicted glycogen debranching enzyme
VSGAAPLLPNERDEWLETDGLGGFASGTTLGTGTRRYHALLVAALVPPAGRHVLVNDAAVWLETPGGRITLSSHHFAPDVSARAALPPTRFRAEPWPRFERDLGGVGVVQEIVMLHGLPLVLMSWRFEQPLPGCTLCVRPLLTGRGFHSLHQRNPGADLATRQLERAQVFQPFQALPAVLSLASGSFRPEPDWYHRACYPRERERGFEACEDLASPGLYAFDLAEPRADWVVAADSPEARAWLAGRAVAEVAHVVREQEGARRGAFPSALHRAADQYVVRRGLGKTIIAGYPWFGDWGRDTFIALRGLCLATGRYRDAAEILLSWAEVVSEGMLPNRFADEPGEPPEYNSVDAALWYVIAVVELIERDPELPAPERAALERAAKTIVVGYRRGTRHGIRLDSDGLLAAGAPGLQLTWMDAKVGDRVITGRVGKPVEVQALWLNALAALGRLGHGGAELLRLGLASFAERFDMGAGGLHDVVDVDHVPGAIDRRVRPNQVLAVGGLPLSLLPAERCRSVLEVVERELWTPIGLRSLAPGESEYAPRYVGGPAERDAIYHQGTVWPWLLGPFVEAWVQCRGGDAAARAQARERFVAPWREHLAQAGIGHVSEIADAEPPHEPRGCPFQAWSVSELLRIERDVLAPTGGRSRRDR